MAGKSQNRLTLTKHHYAVALVGWLSLDPQRQRTKKAAHTWTAPLFDFLGRLPAPPASASASTPAISATTTATTTATATATTTVTAPATATATTRLRPSFVDGQGPPGKLLAIEALNCRLAGCGIGHLDKPEASQPAGLSVGDQVDAFHFSKLREERPDFILGGFVREVPYINV